MNKYKNSISLGLMVAITVLIQLLAVFKSSLVAGYFGTSVEIDAFNYSNSIVTFIFGFIASGISTVIIPEYVNKTDYKNVNAFISYLYGISFVIVALIIVLRSPLIHFLTDGNDKFVEIASNTLVILLFSNYLLSFSNITVAYFQCANRFLTPKIITLLSQSVVVFLLLYISDITIYQYTYVIAAGLVINFVFDIIFAIKAGWRFFPSFIFNEEIKQIVRVFLPILFSAGVYQLTLLVDSTIAARLDSGSVTVLSYSTQISSMLNTVLIGNLLTFTYPKIVKRIRDKESQNIFWEQLALFHLIVCCVIAIFATVGKEGIVFLFEHGKFNSQATKGVFWGSLLYVIGQQTNVLRDLIYRYFYAVGDTKTTALNSLIVSFVNIGFSILFVIWIGFYGIILGTILSSVVSLVMIFIRFLSKIGLDYSFKLISSNILKNLLITASTVGIVYLTKYYLPINNELISIALFGSESIIIFLLLSLLLNKNLKTALERL